jgi:hypothetical protein
MVLGINLLQLLSGLRSEDGIPVNVVLFCGPRETGLSFSSHNEGLSGLLIREFSLPSSVQLLGTLTVDRIGHGQISLKPFFTVKTLFGVVSG